jgi:hypothetical protein
VSVTDNPNKTLYRNFHELCVWIPSLCGHLEVLEELNKKKRGLSADDFAVWKQRGETIGQGIREVISLIPPIHEFEVVQLHHADFNRIDHLAKQLNDFGSARISVRRTSAQTTLMRY